MLVYVIFGGMLATTWVQIVKAVLLMTGTILLSILVLARFDFSIFEFFEAVAGVTGSFCADGAARLGVCPDGSAPIVRDFTQPGLYYHGRWGALSLMSLGIALIFGTAGLPHILVRFYTVPSAQAARTSVVWAMILIGVVLHHDDVPRLRRGDAGREGEHRGAERRTADRPTRTWRRRCWRAKSAARSSSRSSRRSRSRRSSRSSPG